ncbi:MAG: HINT domain-containing protein [Ruminococcus flavefaciens]|nr:HINT domain-containing protein [Ruminococcus flavefaciens]
MKAGDCVLSTDPDTMTTEYKPVRETYIRKVNRLVYLIISGEEIITTIDHPFYVKGRGFIEAGNLLVGDKLVSAIGEDLLIENYNIELIEEHASVYNFQVEDFHTYHVGENGVLVHNAQYETDIGDYKGNRTLEQYEDLAKDPAHKNSLRPDDIKQGEMERNIGLSLEKAGRLDKIVRDPTGKAEFIDYSGQKWDIKSFNSNYPARKGGFALNKAMESINGELNAGENVIVDTTNMSVEHIEALRNAVDTNGLTDNVIFWP